MMHCRLMEVQSACCGNPSNCPEHDVTPRECPVECALVFPFFLESCREALAEQDPGPQPGMEEGAMPEYEKFSASCARQSAARPSEA